MNVIREFPHAVREISHFEIVLADGARLAARMWLPEDAAAKPVPAVLEYLPYRKGDGTAIEDPTRHRYFAGHGIASVRVDMRGSGDSDGVLLDEYTETELDDAVQVIAWLAAQPWCNGSVGMFGISWGGFNALQVAALAPPALRAIITLCSTDDRYADDVHYMGGAVLAREMLGWAMTFLGFNAKPPDPHTVGARWREMWQQRLDATPAFVDTWLAHPKRDDYWRHGSVCEDFAAIRCPVLVVGGWADGYTNSVLRLLDGLGVPSRGIIGPWAHQYPYGGRPGPSIGFLQEAVRWWDHWLNGHERGVLETPKLRVWLQEHSEPQSATWPGQWLGSQLEAAEFETRELYLAAGALQAEPGRAAVESIPDDPHHGAAAGMWCPFGPGELALDQRPDDAVSRTFDSAPLSADLDLLGVPALHVDVADALAGAQIVARLCEVAPDGSSLLLSWGVQTLDGSRSARVRLNTIGHRVRAGHRLRVAVAASYWPVVWPATGIAAPRLVTGTSRLMLPVWRSPGIAVEFEAAESAPHAPFTVLRKGSLTTFDGGAGRRADQGRIRHANGMEVETVFIDEMTFDDAVPTVRCARQFELARGDWQTRIEVTGEMTGDRDAFDVRVGLIASMGEVRCVDRSWTFRIPRRPA
jgi:putative CocE/NonD family hydrolase